MKLHIDIDNQNIYQGCVIVEGHIKTQSADRKSKTQSRMLSTGRPTAVQWTLVVTGKHIDILMQGMHTHMKTPTFTHKNVLIRIILIVPLYISKEFRVIGWADSIQTVL